MCALPTVAPVHSWRGGRFRTEMQHSTDVDAMARVILLFNIVSAPCTIGVVPSAHNPKCSTTLHFTVQPASVLSGAVV